MKRHSRIEKGFTLVELLVVIAIIACLAAILLPVLGAAKAKGQRTACLNNLRQVNIGIRMYAEDSSDAFPVAPPAPKNNDPIEEFCTSYTKLIRSYVGMTDAPSERSKLFACPADTFYYRGTQGLQSQGIHLQSRFDYSSYFFNGGNFPIGTPPVRAPGIGGRKMRSIKHTVKTVLVAEAAAFSPYSWHDARHQGALPYGSYNNAQNMVSFVDGHVSYIKMYWDTNKAANVEAWHYDPPANYDYQWSGD